MFAALLFAAALAGSCGVLLEAAQLAHAPVQRYARAAAVVTGPQSVTTVVHSFGSKPQATQTPLSEPARVPLADAGRLRAVPGVREVIADVSFPVVTATGQQVEGHGWDSAALLARELLRGRPPQLADEVVLGGPAGVRIGSVVELQTLGTPRPYLVSGLIASGSPTVFFAPGTATQLSGHPGYADALAVITAGPPDVAALRGAVPGLEVRTGAARGDTENLAVAAARPDLIAMFGSLCGIAVLMTLVVVGGLIVLAVRERAREFAVLRAIGATPWQLRRRIVRETLSAALPAAAIGGALSLPAGAGMYAAMSGSGALPPGFPLSLTPLPALAAFAVTLLAAAVSALLASLPLSRLRPATALAAAAAEPRELPRWRKATGMTILAAAAGSLGFSITTTGPAADASLSGLVIFLGVAVALFGPVIGRFGSRTLGGAACILSPVAGRLAQHSSGAAALRAGSVITPVALAVAFATVQLSAQSTVIRATQVQAAEGNRASQVLISSGPGLPSSVARSVGDLPGVTAATAVKRTTVVMPVDNLGDVQLERLAALGITAGGGARTMDPGVVSGSLAGLHGQAIALCTDVAGGARAGSSRSLWLGDGTRIMARVAAVYDRCLGFGDVLLPRDLAAAHSSTTLDDYVLVSGTKDLSSVTSRYAGVHAVSATAFHAGLSRELRLAEFLDEVVVGAIAAFVVIGLVTTLALATWARRREFALLRAVGATRRQVLRMLSFETAIILGTGMIVGCLIAAIPLSAFAAAVTGLPLPSMPALPAAAIVTFVAGSGAAAIGIPARLALRRKTTS